MRIVVTGATGNIGSALVAQLAQDERVSTVVGLARRVPDWSPPKTRWETFDLTQGEGSRSNGVPGSRQVPPTDGHDAALVSLLEGADAVVHLAWIFQPTRDPVRTWRVNVRGSLRLFAAAARAKVGALVYSSSVGAYAPGPQTGRVDESWPTHALPTAAYGREKSYLERVLDAYELAHPQMRIVRMRPGFVFQHAAAPEQRRLFAGPLVPGSLLRPEVIPVVPDLPGLRLQTLHAEDAADAFRRATLGEARGAFNVAAEPVVEAEQLGELLDARVMRLPRPVVRAATAAAWHARLVPASPGLLDLGLSLPAMNTGRARRELGWEPRHTSLEALQSFLSGGQDADGGPTPPLAPQAGGPARWREIATGVGATDRLER